MACLNSGPCSPWATVLDLCCIDDAGGFPDNCLLNGEPIPPGLITDALNAASYVVWALSGRRFGICEVTIRPCGMPCDPCGMDSFDTWLNTGGYGYGSGGFTGPALVGGLWYNTFCGCDTCCKLKCAIKLPDPLCEIQEVIVDGIILSPTQYKCWDNKHLQRIYDPAIDLDNLSPCWPHCQDLSLADTEPNTFSVSLSYGRPVPAGGKMAVAELACQMLKSCVGAPCDLPIRVSGITRNGITISKLDPMEFLKDGKTGIYLIDLFLSAVNPHQITRRPAIWSPDMGSWKRESGCS